MNQRNRTISIKLQSKIIAILSPRALSQRIQQASPGAVKNLLLTAMVMFAALVLSACGSGEDSVDSGTSAESAVTEDGVTAREASPEASSLAEKSDGVITATFNGTERTWFITSAERGGQLVSQSDWSPLGAVQSNVSIMGHVSPSSSFRSGEAIMISFTLQGTGENPSVGEPSITYLSGGIANNHSSSHDGSAEVKVSSATIDGDSLTISGTFSGTLPFKSMRGNADVESQETIDVENGTFEGKVRRLQDP